MASHFLLLTADTGKPANQASFRTFGAGLSSGVGCTGLTPARTIAKCLILSHSVFGTPLRCLVCIPADKGELTDFL